MAHGTITMTSQDGTNHEVNVAGTLDLFGFDDFGNFYIFDMKTTRNHSKQKLEEEKAKWSRQVSMYADLLKQSYPEISISKENLRVIPINVDYPAPMGRGAGMSIGGPEYTVDKKTGQLQMTYRGKKPINYVAGEGSDNIALRSTTVKGQFPTGYTAFNINWDNLSSEDQDIAEGLEQQAPQESKPQEAHIETPKPGHPSFIAADGFMNQDNQGSEEHKEPAKQAPPIIPNGTQGILPQWRHLSAGAKVYLANEEGIETAEDYADILNDPATAEAIKQKLTCKELL